MYVYNRMKQNDHFTYESRSKEIKQRNQEDIRRQQEERRRAKEAGEGSGSGSGGNNRNFWGDQRGDGSRSGDT